MQNDSTFTYRMLLLMCCIMVCGSVLYAQTRISGIVNAYRPVTQITAFCGAIVSVTDATPFAVGDRVMLIQMRGASLSTQPDVNNGSMLDVRACGLYEFSTIRTISGQNITLNTLLSNTYNTGTGNVQLVKVAVYNNNVEITAPLRCPVWNPNTGGGVIAIQVNGTLTLQDSITANGCGFAGGVLTVGSDRCDATVFVTDARTGLGAYRGEGTAVASPGQECGRARLSVGGGGGVSHNSGGGGGASVGNGGSGGNQYLRCAAITNGGMGGEGLGPPTNGFLRLFLGGGGGAGHQNNTHGTAGVNGGGIIHITATRIEGNSSTICANGLSVTALAGNDAAGGGGGGGSIFIETSTLGSTINLQARGGDGGNISDNDAHGPGGGGGGGRIILRTALPQNLVQANVLPGASGANIRLNGANRTKGALPGEPGWFGVYGQVPPEREIPKLTIDGPKTISTCSGEPVVLEVTAGGGTAPYGYRWSTGETGSRITVSPSVTTTYSVIASDALGCVTETTYQVIVGVAPEVVIADLNVPISPCGGELETKICIRNPLNTQLIINNVALATANATVIGPFQFPAVVEPDSLLCVTIRVKAKTTFTDIIKVTIGPCDSTIDVRIHGDIQNRLVVFSHDSIFHDTIQCSTDSIIDTITVTNGGDASIVVSNIAVTGMCVRYSSSTPVPVTVMPGTSEQFIIYSKLSGLSGPTFSGTTVFTITGDGCTEFKTIPVNTGERKAIDTIYSELRFPNISNCSPVADTIEFLGAQVPGIVDTLTLVDYSISAPFELVGLPVNRLAPGEQLQLRVAAFPNNVGDTEGILIVRYSPCDVVYKCIIHIRKDSISVRPSPYIELGKQLSGSINTRVVTFTNVGSVPVTAEDILPVQAPFQILSTTPVLPVVIQPGGVLEVLVQITPVVGMDTAVVTLVVNTPCVLRPQTSISVGASVATTVALPKLEVHVGDIIDIPVSVQSFEGIPSRLLRGFDIELVINDAGVRVLEMPNTNSNFNYTVFNNVVTGSGVWDGVSALGNIRAEILLTKDSILPLVWQPDGWFTWKDVAADIFYENGEIRILDVCVSRSIRLVKFVGSLTNVRVQPNPARDRIQIFWDETTEAVSTKIYDILGREYTTGTTLMPGQYTVIVSTAFESVTLSVIVE